MSAAVVSVGISRLFRVVRVEAEGSGDYMPNKVYRIEQAHKDSLTKKWKWKVLATAAGREAHNEAIACLHQMQAEFLDEMQKRQGSFKVERYSG